MRSREVVINLPLFDDDDLLLFFAFSGSQIEPYGIDYILQRLGFNHARTTIPKWCQRGCMDPLDKILSVIVLKTIQVVKEERKIGKVLSRNYHKIFVPIWIGLE